MEKNVYGNKKKILLNYFDFKCSIIKTCSIPTFITVEFVKTLYAFLNSLWMVKDTFSQLSIVKKRKYHTKQNTVSIILLTIL